MKLNYYRIDEAKMLVPLPVEALTLPGPEETSHWLDVEAPEPESLRQLLAPLGLPDQVLEQCLRLEHAPDVNLFEKNIHLEFPLMPEWEETTLPYLSIVCFRNLLLTIHQNPVPTLAKVIVGLQRETQLPEMNVSVLLYFIFTALLDQDVQVLRKVRLRVDRLADALDDNPDTVELGDILELKRQVGQVETVYEDQFYCLSTLQAVETAILDTHGKNLKELSENLAYGIRSVNRLETRLKDMHFQYMLALQDKSERRLRLLTIISAIFLPLTLMTGIYGMNFNFMPELQWHYAYFTVLGVMATFIIVALLFFYRRGWFD